MDAKQKTDLVNALLAGVVNSSNEAKTMPPDKGDIYVFTLDENLIKNRSSVINGATVEWSEVVDIEGKALSAQQIARRNNGLRLKGNTLGERLKSFLDLFDENDTLKIKIKGIRRREFFNTDDSGIERRTFSNYYIFEVVQ